MRSRQQKKTRQGKSTRVVADQPPADVPTAPRFLSYEERAKHFSVLADATKSNRERDEVRLSDFVVQLKTGSQPFNLLNCLTVLLEDHRLREGVAAEATARQQAKFAERVSALADALKNAASKKKSAGNDTMPTVIASLFTAADLRIAVVEHQNEIKRARKAQRDNPSYSVKVNWPSYAETILPKRLREIGKPDVRHPNATAWTRALDWLITNARTIGMNRDKIEKWVRRGGKAKKSTGLTVEFERLDRERAHITMMKHLRDEITQTAEECIRLVRSIEREMGSAEEVSWVLMWRIRDTWIVASGLSRFLTKSINALPDTVFSLAEIREKLHELFDLVYDRVVDASGGVGLPPTETVGGKPWTEKQRAIWKILHRRALTADGLVAALGEAGMLCDRSRLVTDHVKPMSATKPPLVQNDKAVGGYYRPDAPPLPD